MGEEEIDADVRRPAALQHHDQVAVCWRLGASAVGRDVASKLHLPPVPALAPIRQPDIPTEHLPLHQRHKVSAVERLRAVRKPHIPIRAHWTNTPGVRCGTKRIRTACCRIIVSTPIRAVIEPFDALTLSSGRLKVCS